VHPQQLRLERPQQVRLHGKGGKERVCPLWAETAADLRQVVKPDAPINLSFKMPAVLSWPKMVSLTC